MDLKEPKSIMVEYGKVKAIKANQYQNEGTENRAMAFYETEAETQTVIRKINRYNGKQKKYIKSKATRTRNQFKERADISSRETEIEENNRGKTNQTEKKHGKTCCTYGTKGHKIKECESELNFFMTCKEKLNTQELKSIIEE